MPIDRRWTWIHTTFSAALLFGLLVWLVAGKGGDRLAGDLHAPPRPATINNVVLSIESNIIRIQVAMENLVFSEDPAELASKVKSITQLEATVYKDFKRMGAHFPDGSPQYQKVLALFSQWKGIRDEIIRLTAAGPSPLAKKLVRGKCAAQAQQIRAALAGLASLSNKRRQDFDSDAARKRGRNQ